ncbi:MAG TPA: ATP-binding protein [Longimicrobium sp.]|jgi:signal transduction histidine kinase|uniref:sensor histidine kinase n=1 Tax=Longimicrobium sp. TaxID=2029185 RepID=UPI002EDA190C
MSDSESLEVLRSQLQDVVTADKLDIDRVVELSSKVAKKDPDFVRFSTDAAIISRLGRELVAKQETAVAELIKNAYDADARTVVLTYSGTDRSGGSLRIEDDGLGMTREELVDGFMRLSSTEKLSHPYSPKYGRRRAGKKGIGRFAVQRLGTELCIVTQTKDSTCAFRVELDWNAFAAGRDLATISNRITVAPKERAEGTTLIISNLREAWTEAAIRRVYRFVSELLQPFPLGTSTRLGSDHPAPLRVAVDPGFKATLQRAVSESVEVVADESTSIFSHALAEISAIVDEDGRGAWSLVSDRLGLREVDQPIGRDRNDSQQPFKSLHNISLRAYYFIVASDLIPRSMVATIREMAQEKGGVRVYRNGFRVLPYGERDDDWLGLDASTRARDILPPHANSNFFGFVEIVDPEGATFEETSSREGLLENEAFSELQDFCSRVLKSAALRVAATRGRKQTASQRDWPRPDQNPGPTDRLLRIAESLSAAAGSSATATRPPPPTSGLDPDPGDLPKGLSGVVARAAQDLLIVAAEEEERRQELIEELGMLRVLASLGLAIGEFTHEVRQILGAAHLSAKAMVEALSEHPLRAEAEDLYANVQRFRTYASYFYRAIADNASRELEQQDIAYVLREFVQATKPAATRSGIQLDLEITGYGLTTTPMHSSEISSILFNLYSNSHKAIKRAHSQGRMLLRAGMESDRIFIECADNGDGIPPQNAERIFSAFFTTSGSTGLDASEHEELQGSGLGLKIVRDIVESYEGDVFVSSAPEGYVTSIRIELPTAIEED